ncbi:MAG: hypothetical protein K0B07_05410 [DPANN group archaeon]|nr:hypothetical protein [DPANN group archaeon]
MKNKNVLLGMISFSLMLILSAGFAFAATSISSVLAPLKSLSVGVLTPFGLDSLEGIIIMITFALMIGGFLEVLKIFDGNTKVVWGIGLGGSLILMYNLVTFNLMGALLSLGLITMLIFLFLGILFSSYGWVKNRQKGADTAGFEQKANKIANQINKNEMTYVNDELNKVLADEGHLHNIVFYGLNILAAGSQNKSQMNKKNLDEIEKNIKGISRDNPIKENLIQLQNAFNTVSGTGSGMVELASLVNECKNDYNAIVEQRKNLEKVRANVTQLGVKETVSNALDV